jgi:hypothetical protein
LFAIHSSFGNRVQITLFAAVDQRHPKNGLWMLPVRCVF